MYLDRPVALEQEGAEYQMKETTTTNKPCPGEEQFSPTPAQEGQDGLDMRPGVSAGLLHSSDAPMPLASAESAGDDDPLLSAEAVGDKDAPTVPGEAEPRLLPLATMPAEGPETANDDDQAVATRLREAMLGREALRWLNAPELRPLVKAYFRRKGVRAVKQAHAFFWNHDRDAMRFEDLLEGMLRVDD